MDMKDKFFVSVKWCSSINFFIQFKTGRIHQIIYSDLVYHRSLNFIFDCTQLSSLYLTYYRKTSSLDLKAERWRIKHCPWLFALKVKYYCCCEIVPYLNLNLFGFSFQPGVLITRYFFSASLNSLLTLSIFFLYFQIISKSLVREAIQNKFFPVMSL